METVENLIQQFSLAPHPEGGFYKETYRSTGLIAAENLTPAFAGSRPYSTAIYFLLPAGMFSAFHAISSDECWHFYDGLPLHIYIIEPNGNLNVVKLGRNIQHGEVYQAVVPAHCWFASRPAGSSGYSFTGCTVAPGFDFADFRMAGRAALLANYPQHQNIIAALTR